LEWALLLLALLVAALLRFWQLDHAPPGLYRDEAFNGLDAIGVLKGNHALFFPANNGREPLYIYLTAVAVAIWGQTIFAVRAAAALIGTLTTIAIYLLGKTWFGWRTGIIAAWIWAITLWPVHLSRIGLRTILIVPVLALTFWLATAAYRQQKAWLWGSAGMLYGLGFYTYLAFRFTPLLLLLVVLYLILTDRRDRLWPGVLWFAAGSLIVILPLALLILLQPDLFFGRSGQVSILHPDVYEGSVLITLAKNIGASLGMFLWRGDSILRHNPPGRPVFDRLLAIPFIIGFLYCLRNWRKPPAMTVLLWLFVMLGPTILAADAPHFLRASAVLPAAVLLPAVGLAWIWQWPRIPSWAGALVTACLLAGSLAWTIKDYRAYSADPQLAFAFEAAAAELAGELQSEGPETEIFLDDRLWTSWPSLSFLVTDEERIMKYLSTEDLPDKFGTPSSIYAWPYDSINFIPERLDPPLLLAVSDGPLTRGDLEAEAYPLYAHYSIESPSAIDGRPLAGFGDQVYLRQANVVQLDPDIVQVDIYWEAENAVDDDLVVFVHAAGPEGLVGQDDAPLAQGRWPGAWWQPGVIIQETHIIKLSEPFDSSRHQITLGLYRAGSGERLPLIDLSSGQDGGTAWTISGE
jgi:4-amino-4-deoxy-L-arabinose transferase-like glycosyltransferase